MNVLFALLLSSAAQATTAQVCVRNDGGGTFRPGSLTVTADTQGSDHDGGATGPAAALAPGGDGCITVSGLRATDPARPDTAYTFTVSWLDGLGSSSITASPVILDVDKYVGQAGAHSYYLDPSSYIGLVNAPPTAGGALSVQFSERPARCAGTAEPAATVDQDFGTYRLQRAEDDGSWSEVDAWQTHASHAFSDEGMNSTEDARYRLVTEDQYGAQTPGPESVCAGSAVSGAPDSGGGGGGGDGGDGTDGEDGTGSGDGADGTGADGSWTPGDDGGSGADGWTPGGGAEDDDDDEGDKGCQTAPGLPGLLLAGGLGAVVVGRRRRRLPQ